MNALEEARAQGFSTTSTRPRKAEGRTRRIAEYEKADQRGEGRSGKINARRQADVDAVTARKSQGEGREIENARLSLFV